MPLSDNEQKILSEIERHLVEDDPVLAREIGRDSASSHLTRLRTGVLLGAAGLVALIAFFVSRLLVVGVAAFALMVAGCFVASLAVRGLWGSRMPPGRDARAVSHRFFATLKESIQTRFKPR